MEIENMKNKNMTAKEKAIELINKYRGFSCQKCYGSESDIVTAKQCAMICVNEILLSNPLKYSIKYIREVIKEIEKY